MGRTLPIDSDQNVTDQNSRSAETGRTDNELANDPLPNNTATVQMVVAASSLSHSKLKFLKRIEIFNSEVRDYLRSQIPKPQFVPGFSPIPVQSGSTFYSDSGSFFPGHYGAEVVHSGLSGIVTAIEPSCADSISSLVT